MSKRVDRVFVLGILAIVSAGCAAQSEAPSSGEEEARSAATPIRRRTGVACPGASGGACASGERCCRSPLNGPAVCAAAGAACPDARAKEWACSDARDCARGDSCCGIGVTGAVASGISVHRFLGTRCASSCGAGEFVACSAGSECASGACVATRACGMAIGVCR